MTHEVMPNLAYGNEAACRHTSDGSLAVVHACKEPCHRQAVGYSQRSLPSSHPNYLALETEHHVYLNMIDPPQPLFMMPSFEAFFAFVDRHIDERKVIVHCNQGESRAPSLALLYVAKRTEQLPNDSYAEAAQAFRKEFPYNPGQGIQIWLEKHWGELG